MTYHTIIIIAFLGIAQLAIGQNAEKTMLKSFNLSGKDAIRLDLPGQVEIKTWEQPFVKIEITVSLPNGNSAMLNELANIGRYNLTENTEGTKLIVSSPNLSKIIKVRGQDLRENIVFQVYAPKEIPVTVSQDLTASTHK